MAITVLCMVLCFRPTFLSLVQLLSSLAQLALTVPRPRRARGAGEIVRGLKHFGGNITIIHYIFTNYNVTLRRLGRRAPRSPR